MRAHAHDLRAEVDDDEFVNAIASHWPVAELSSGDRALCAFAEKLTEAPAGVSGADVEGLRAEGFADEAIHDATQVIAYFNYINRVADALGVESEAFVRKWEQPRG